MKEKIGYSVDLWLLTALLLATATLNFSQKYDQSIIASADDSNVFIVGECPDGKNIFGWGKRSVGFSNISYESGCFDSLGEKLIGADSFSACRSLACNF